MTNDPVCSAVTPARFVPTGVVIRRTIGKTDDATYYTYLPGTFQAGNGVLVIVHGASRQVALHIEPFISLAEASGMAIVAPLFDEIHHPDYQRLGRRRRHADRVLIAILEDAADWLSIGSSTYIAGFSGGAQFAQRFTFAYPERIRAAALVAPGWYTFPDATRRYPYGIATSRRRPDLKFDPEAFLVVPITVFVGDRDEGGAHLRRTPRLDTQQGVTRVARARTFVATMREAADRYGLSVRTALVEIPGIGHEFDRLANDGDLAVRVGAAFFGPGSCTDVTVQVASARPIGIDGFDGNNVEALPG